MIDIKKAEEEFKKYVSNYDITQKPIERKKFHTLRVEKICEDIAKKYGMSEEDIKLAKLIGVLHDIARFEQHRIYNTYNDVISIDHGDFGVSILKKDNYIRKYIEDNKYDNIIFKAIKYHNKYAIGEDVKDKEKVFCEIIRDADKLDILFLASTSSWQEKEEYIIKQTISDNVLEQFRSGNLINDKNIKKDIEWIIRAIAFIYDYSFKESYEIIKANNYINKIIDRFDYELEETKNQMEEIRNIANEYINNKLKEE